jgi:hypothetical protein
MFKTAEEIAIKTVKDLEKNAGIGDLLAKIKGAFKRLSTPNFGDFSNWKYNRPVTNNPEEMRRILMDYYANMAKNTKDLELRDLAQRLHRSVENVDASKYR